MPTAPKKAPSAQTEHETIRQETSSQRKTAKPQRTHAQGKPKTTSRSKNFVLDTNVILHDYECVDKFEDNDIYLPIVVLEELDKFKKGSDQINFNARAFVRKLDDLAGADFFERGADLGEGRGRLYVYLGNKPHERVAHAFGENIPDHKILSATLHIAEANEGEQTILVSKDINLRMKAKSLGIPVEDYFNDKVPTFDIFEEAQPVFEGVDAELINRLYDNEQGISLDDLEFGSKLLPNECFVLKSDQNSVLARYNPFEAMVQRVDKYTHMGITPRNAEQAFAFEVLMDPNVLLVALSGKAGTGKTLLALAAALDQADRYGQIMLARPIVALANKDLGALPGTEQEKVRPYMQPLFDNLNVIKSQFKGGKQQAELEKLQQDNKLIIEALAYLRGRSLADAIVIVDEAQNLTPHEVKTIITRAGEGTKMIFCGDVEQIDSPYLDSQSNGLAYMIDKMRGETLFAHVNLIKGERSELSELASHLL
ncbi:MAG: PhoH family protein [Porphyromonas sp.]|uniref:PhoH family protein n=1 Tax=Porphyromonas sp. TaxID=1924944 RepID=UPI001A48F81E|nr:PhoH family protein [Porphyromonas sp.]MBL6452257.1 PhoH family protein [Porphyromonas sp.]